MRRLSAWDLVELSEAGAGMGPAGRAILMLEASGAMARPAIEALPLGQRERWLLAWRAGQFGPRLDLAHACEACGEVMAFGVTATDLGLDQVQMPAAIPQAHAQADGRTVAVRAVTAGDMAAAEQGRSPAEAQAILKARVAPDGAGLLDEALDTVLASLDPEADLTLDVACADCGHRQALVLDLASFVWRELEIRVPRLLQQVAELAHAFHWSEREILAMPAARRRFYLAAIGA